MADNNIRAWHAVITKGSAALKKKLTAKHGDKPEFQQLLKRTGQDKETWYLMHQKKQARLRGETPAATKKKREEIGLKAWGATKGTRMGGEEGGGLTTDAPEKSSKTDAVPGQYRGAGPVKTLSVAEYMKQKEKEKRLEMAKKILLGRAKMNEESEQIDEVRMKGQEPSEALKKVIVARKQKESEGNPIENKFKKGTVVYIDGSEKQKYKVSGHKYSAKHKEHYVTFDGTKNVVSHKNIQRLSLSEKNIEEGLDKACWKGYTAIGMKKKNGRKVPNCVPVSEEECPVRSQHGHKRVNQAFGLDEETGRNATPAEHKKTLDTLLKRPDLLRTLRSLERRDQDDKYNTKKEKEFKDSLATKLRERSEQMREEHADKLKGTPVVSFSDFTSKDYTKNVPKKLKKDDPRVKFHKDTMEEAATSDNTGYGKGYHGNVGGDDKKYSSMHTKVKGLVGAAGHLSDVKKPNMMVKHFLDSTHGRHVADQPSDSNITSRFKKFKNTYNPEMHEAATSGRDASKQLAKLIQKKTGGKETAVRSKKTGLLVLRKNPMKEEAEQMDELNKSTIASYVGKAREDMKKTVAKNRALASMRSTDDVVRGSKQAGKRDKGISRAYAQLNKEEYADYIKDYGNSRAGRAKALAQHQADQERSKGNQSYKTQIHVDGRHYEAGDRAGGESGAQDAARHAVNIAKKTGKKVSVHMIHHETGKTLAISDHEGGNWKYRNMSEELMQEGPQRDKTRAMNKLKDAIAGANYRKSGMPTPGLDAKRKTPQALNKAIGRGLRNMGEEAEQIDELSKQTLGSYIKKSSHDVATKGALVRHFATKSKDEKSKDNFMQARKDDETANKIFNKSWKRRQGMAKAVDRMTKEEAEQIDELSKKTKDAYVAKRGSQLSSMMYGLDKHYNSLTGKQQANAVKGIKRAMGVKEEAEQIDELNRNTLRDYVAKAYADKKRRKALSRFDTETFDEYLKGAKKFDNRNTGITRAYARLNKEEAEQIDELNLDRVGKESPDIDNDKDVDRTDLYLHNKRNAIKKAITKKKLDEGKAAAVADRAIQLQRGKKNKINKTPAIKLDLKANQAPMEASPTSGEDQNA